MVLEGTPKQVMGALISLKEEIDNSDMYYLSESTNELLLISDMNEQHIRNAINKQYRDWLTRINKLVTKSYLTELRSGPATKTITTLLKELIKRNE